MPYPPAVLPINRTDGTAQQSNHIADHNGANQAINDIVSHVNGIDSQISGINTAITRFGTLATASGTNIGAGAVAPLIFESVSVPAWGGGVAQSGLFTVPTGQAGLYVVTFRVVSPAITASPADVMIVVGSVTYTTFIPVTKNTITHTVALSLGDGGNFKLNVYNPNAAAAFFSGGATIARVST